MKATTNTIGLLFALLAFTIPFVSQTHLSALNQSETASVDQQEDWQGRWFMPRVGATFKSGAQDVPYSKLQFPCRATKASNGWLLIGKAWTKKSDLIPLDDAVAYYTNYLENDRTSAWCYHNRGIVWQSQGDLNKALQDFHEAIRLNPTPASYIQRGIVWEKRGDFESALSDYSEAIRLNPKQSNAFNNRGIVLSLTGKTDDALDDFTEAIRLAPKSALYRFNRGTLWGKQGEWEKARDDLSESIRLDPRKANAYHSRGVAWIRTGHEDKALLDFDEAIRLDPQSISSRRSRALIWMAKQEWEKAIAELDDALELAPRDASLLMTRGKTWAGQNKLAQALADYNTAARIIVGPTFPGFEWQSCKDAKLLILKPRAWHFKEVISEGNYNYFISKEDIDLEGKFQTGVTIWFFPDLLKRMQQTPADFLAEQIMQRVKPDDAEKVHVWFPGPNRVGIRTQLVKEAEELVIQELLIADPSDSVHLILFEAPKRERDKSSRIRDIIFATLILREST